MMFRNILFKNKVFIAALILSGFSSFAQDFFPPSPNKPLLRAHRSTEKIKLDGHLNEGSWAAAPFINLGFQVEPYQGQKANFNTHVRMISHPKYLYVAAICYDTVGKNRFRAPNLKRDYMFQENDLLGIAFDGFLDRRNALVLQSNAYGAQRDLLAFDDRQYDIDWDALYRVRTHRSDTAWVAEFEIPWQTLRYPRYDEAKKDSITWGLNFFRVRRTSNEVSTWSPHPRSTSALRMEYAGLLKGILPPQGKVNNIRLVPYFLYSAAKNQGTELNPSLPNALKMGGELKWAIKANNVLDLTFNTDFAQADVDRQVNNITRFSVFFPERRQFFLENASLFNVGLSPVDEVIGGSMYIQPFFSRKIGLDQQARAVPIQAGVRFVHRSDRRNFGGLLLRQGEGDGVQSTQFSVLRYSQNVGNQNRLGLLYTGKNSSLNQEQTMALDGFVRLSNVLSFSGMLSGTNDQASGRSGFAEFGQFLWRDNLWTAYWTHTIVNKDYQPGIGFVARTDIMSNSQGFSINVRSKKLPKWIRSYEPGVYTEFYHSLSQQILTERRVLFSPAWFGLQSGGQLGIYAEHSFQRLLEEFTPLNIRIPLGEYQNFRKGFVIGTDPSNKYALMLNREFGGYFDGQLIYSMMRASIAPIPNINIGLSLERNDFRSLGMLKTDRKIDLMQLEGRFALNPRLQLIGFYQTNTNQDRRQLNLRLSWEYQPLSFVYLVLNQGEFLGSDQSIQKERVFLSKLSYLKQF